MADNDYRLLISIAGLALIGVIAVVVSWLVDRCHDRVSIRDDVSDISENTRNLLKARMVINMIVRKDKVEASERNNAATAEIARAWRIKALRGSLDPDEDIKNLELKVNNDRPTIAVTDTSLSIVNEAENARNAKQHIKTGKISDIAKMVNGNDCAAVPVHTVIDDRPSHINNLTSVFKTIEISSKSANMTAVTANCEVMDDGRDQTSPLASHAVSVITRPKSTKPSGMRNSGLVSLFKNVPLDTSNKAQSTERAAARSLTAVEVAVSDTNIPS